MTDPRIGTVVGERFEIRSKVGEGGMGVVYLAEDRTANAQAAIKFLHTQLMANEDFVQRFRQEGKSASRFRHPHAVQVLDGGEDDEGIPWLAMEYCGGQSLKRILSDQAPLPSIRACRIGKQIVEAVGEAHKNGIKVFTYVNHAFWGRHSWEILREHPEWAMYLANGQWDARFNVEDTGGQSGVVPEDIYKMARCNASVVNMSAVDVGTDALIAGAEMWGYDGARWDGQWTVSGDYGTHDFYDINGKLSPRYPESDKHAVRNAKRCKQRLRKARPGFLFGYNYGGSYESVQPVTSQRAMTGLENYAANGGSIYCACY